MSSIIQVLTKSAAARRIAAPAASTAVLPTRSYHATPLRQYAYKDTQDRESLKPVSNEGTRSARDADVAENSDAAFNPDKTSPEAAERAASQGNDKDPLNASGANQKINKPQGDEKDLKKTGSGKETRKGGTSGGGSAPKSQDPKDL